MPYLRVSQPKPPPSVSPATPVVELIPSGVAKPWTWVAASTCASVASITSLIHLKNGEDGIAPLYLTLPGSVRLGKVVAFTHDLLDANDKPIAVSPTLHSVAAGSEEGQKEPLIDLDGGPIRHV